jgi:hypothetical protein
VGRIVVTQYLSLDGVMEAPRLGDVEDFRHSPAAPHARVAYDGR